VRGKHAEHPAGVLAFAILARNRRVSLAHRAQGIKLFPAIGAVIFINWHGFTSFIEIASHILLVFSSRVNV
jgi:vacuolar-type H+-ATPase subunit I/STV1